MSAPPKITEHFFKVSTFDFEKKVPPLSSNSIKSHGK